MAYACWITPVLCASLCIASEYNWNINENWFRLIGTLAAMTLVDPATECHWAFPGTPAIYAHRVAVTLPSQEQTTTPLRCTSFRLIRNALKTQETTMTTTTKKPIAQHWQTRVALPDPAASHPHNMSISFPFVIGSTWLGTCISVRTLSELSSDDVSEITRFTVHSLNIRNVSYTCESCE